MPEADETYIEKTENGNDIMHATIENRWRQNFLKKTNIIS